MVEHASIPMFRQRPLFNYMTQLSSADCKATRSFWMSIVTVIGEATFLACQFDADTADEADAADARSCRLFSSRKRRPPLQSPEL